jgi:hypothetical protein
MEAASAGSENLSDALIPDDSWQPMKIEKRV